MHLCPLLARLQSCFGSANFGLGFLLGLLVQLPVVCVLRKRLRAQAAEAAKQAAAAVSAASKGRLGLGGRKFGRLSDEDVEMEQRAGMFDGESRGAMRAAEEEQEEEANGAPPVEPPTRHPVQAGTGLENGLD